jgi:hypothetical protein
MFRLLSISKNYSTNIQKTLLFAFFPTLSLVLDHTLSLPYRIQFRRAGSTARDRTAKDRGTAEYV